MAAPVSKDLRGRVVRAVEEEGMSRRGAAARFGVAIRTAERWVDAYRENRSLAPQKVGNPSPPKLSARRETVLRLPKEQPDYTIEGLRHDLADRLAVGARGLDRRAIERVAG
jgi:transposase